MKQCGQEIIAGSHPHVQERQLWIEETSQDRERKSDAFDSKPRGAEKFSDYFRRHRNGSKQLEKNLFEAQYDYNEQILILPDPDGIREHHFRKNEIPVILSDDDPPDDIYDNSSQDDQHMVHVVVDDCSPSLCRPVQLQDIVHDGNRTLAYVSPILFQNRFEPEDPWEEKYLPAIPVDKNYEEIFYHEDDCDLRALNSVSNHETENLLRLQDSPSTGFPCLAQNDLDRLLPDPESSFSADISSGIYGFEIVNEISNQEEEGVDVLSEAVRLSLSFSSEHFDEREGHGEFRPKMSNLQFDEDYNAGIDEELDPGDVFHLSSNYNAKNSNRHVTSPQLSLSPLPTFDALIRDDKVSINAQDIVV